MVTTTMTCNSCAENGPAVVTLTVPECSTTEEPECTTTEAPILTTPCPTTTVHVVPAVPTYVYPGTTEVPSRPVYTGAAMANAMERGVAGVAAALAIVAML